MSGRDKASYLWIQSDIGVVIATFDIAMSNASRMDCYISSLHLELYAILLVIKWTYTIYA